MVDALRFRPGHDVDAAARQSASLAALAVILLVIVAGLWLTDILRAQADLQDCVLSGRAGCAVGAG